MPYIKEYLRGDYEPQILPTTSGELNFVITKNCLGFLKMEGESYDTYNSIIGALECAKQEIYRRMISPYEDKKITENGDVY